MAGGVALGAAAAEGVETMRRYGEEPNGSVPNRRNHVRIARLLAATLAATLTAVPLAQADGPALETLELGKGPTVVLVPGLGGTRMDWLPTVKRLRERFHCVMVELPGQGKSALPDPFSLEAAAGALDAVVAKQNGDSTVLVGSGVGGVLALISASAHPGHQRAVLLIDTPLKSPMQIPDQQRDEMMKFIEENYQQFSQMAFSKMGRDSAESALLYAAFAAVPPATVKAYLRGMMNMDVNRDLKALHSTLGLAFSEKAWKSGTSWSSVAKTLGYEDTTVAAPFRIGSSGPMVMKDQPDTLATLISAIAAKGFAAKK
jgi:pimeloyl-ACP methyl ester carboxylesterase